MLSVRTTIQHLGTTPKGTRSGHKIVVPSLLSRLLGPVGTAVVVTAYDDRLEIRALPGEKTNGHEEEEGSTEEKRTKGRSTTDSRRVGGARVRRR